MSFDTGLLNIYLVITQILIQSWISLSQGMLITGITLIAQVHLGDVYLMSAFTSARPIF